MFGWWLLQQCKHERATLWCIASVCWSRLLGLYCSWNTHACDTVLWPLCGRRNTSVGIRFVGPVGNTPVPCRSQVIAYNIICCADGIGSASAAHTRETACDYSLQWLTSVGPRQPAGHYCDVLERLFNRQIETTWTLATRNDRTAAVSN